MDKSQLLKRLDEGWNALQEASAGLSASEMMEPGVNGAWSVKDIIAHVTSWEGEALKYLPLILDGKRPPRYSVAYGGIDAFNAKINEQTRKLSLDEVLRQRDETHHALIDFIQDAPEEQFTRETPFRHRLRLDTYRHYPEHTATILKWRCLNSEAPL